MWVSINTFFVCAGMNTVVSVYICLSYFTLLGRVQAQGSRALEIEEEARVKLREGSRNNATVPVQWCHKERLSHNMNRW